LPYEPQQIPIGQAIEELTMLVLCSDQSEWKDLIIYLPPVRFDPAHALILPSRCGAAPVAAYHEPMKKLPDRSNTLQSLKLAYLRDFDLAG